MSGPESPIVIKGRGALSNPAGRFEHQTTEAVDDGWGEDPRPDTQPATQLLPDKTRNIIARNTSPDVFFDQSINPYKGCEHGCVYCFARPSHAYLDLSPGIDFETKIFYKTDVPARLVEAISKPGYVCSTIALGANTDPYQPVEKRLQITRSILTTLLAWRHPVAIVTKGALVLRDIDLLAELAAHGLTSVGISLTTLDNKLKTTLEPSAAGPAARLRCMRELTAAGIPVGVLMAPVIPGINDHEIEDIAAAAAEAGARSITYVLLRLPYEVKDSVQRMARNARARSRQPRDGSAALDARRPRLRCAMESTPDRHRTARGSVAQALRTGAEEARPRRNAIDRAAHGSVSRPERGASGKSVRLTRRVRVR